MKLASLQQAFWSLATRARAQAEHEPAAIFIGSEALSGASRIAIYADMFLWRQVDCLRDDYPKLAALLGEDEFFALAEAYLRAHPSRHHSLALLGQQLPKFLREYAHERADLSDLAALEWARVEVFDERDVAVADADALSQLALDVEQSLTFIPALRSLWLEHAVCDRWREIEGGLPASAPRRHPSAVVVWRKQFEVFHVQLEPHEAAAFDRAAAGSSLAVICEAFEEQENPVVAAFRVLASWYAEGWIAADSK